MNMNLVIDVEKEIFFERMDNTREESKNIFESNNGVKEKIKSLNKKLKEIEKGYNDIILCCTRCGTDKMNLINMCFFNTRHKIVLMIDTLKEKGDNKMILYFKEIEIKNAIDIKLIDSENLFNDKSINNENKIDMLNENINKINRLFSSKKELDESVVEKYNETKNKIENMITTIKTEKNKIDNGFKDFKFKTDLDAMVIEAQTLLLNPFNKLEEQLKYAKQIAKRIDNKFATDIMSPDNIGSEISIMVISAYSNARKQLECWITELNNKIETKKKNQKNDELSEDTDEKTDNKKEINKFKLKKNYYLIKQMDNILYYELSDLKTKEEKIKLLEDRLTKINNMPISHPIKSDECLAVILSNTIKLYKEENCSNYKDVNPGTSFLIKRINKTKPYTERIIEDLKIIQERINGIKRIQRTCNSIELKTEMKDLKIIKKRYNAILLIRNSFMMSGVMDEGYKKEITILPFIVKFIDKPYSELIINLISLKAKKKENSAFVNLIVDCIIKYVCTVKQIKVIIVDKQISVQYCKQEEQNRNCEVMFKQVNMSNISDFVHNLFKNDIKRLK